MSNLQSLSLVGSDNNMLPNWNEVPFTNLTHLNLKGCGCDVDAICKRFTRLKYLDVSRRARWGYTQAPTLPTKSLFELTQLEYLDISNFLLNGWDKGNFHFLDLFIDFA